MAKRDLSKVKVLLLLVAIIAALIAVLAFAATQTTKCQPQIFYLLFLAGIAQKFCVGKNGEVHNGECIDAPGHNGAAPAKSSPPGERGDWRTRQFFFYAT
jgi:hypothetical protein